MLACKGSALQGPGHTVRSFEKGCFGTPSELADQQAKKFVRSFHYGLKNRSKRESDIRTKLFGTDR
jgi:hypothetical protein